MKDIRRLCLVRFFRVLRQFFAFSKPSERRSIGVDIPWRLGNNGDARVRLDRWVDRSARANLDMLDHVLPTTGIFVSVL
jgi:hypothetical protein